LLPGTGWPQAHLGFPDESSVRLRIGDSLSTVQQVLHTSKPPTNPQGEEVRALGQIRLDDRGIWVFLDADNQARQFRFDTPFAGDIHGAKIGQSVEEVQQAMGVPGRDISHMMASGKSFIYHVDSGATIRCDFDQSQRLITIRVLAGDVKLTEFDPREAGGSAAPRSPSRIFAQSTDVTVPGSLAITQRISCIELNKITMPVQPPDLYAAVAECMASGRYTDAVALFMMAGVEVRFDSARVSDKTAGQVGQVMIMNTFNPLPQEQRQKFFEAFNVMLADPRAMTPLCNDVARFDPPTYYPGYMILHGIEAFRGDPTVNALEPNFDATAVWAEVRGSYLHCPPPR